MAETYARRPVASNAETEVFGKLTTLIEPWLAQATRLELAVINWLSLRAHNLTHHVERSIMAMARALKCDPESVRRAVRSWQQRGVLERHDGPEHNSTPTWVIAFARKARKVWGHRSTTAIPAPVRELSTPPKPRMNTHSRETLVGVHTARQGLCQEERERARRMILGGASPQTVASTILGARRDDSMSALTTMGVTARRAWSLASAFTVERIRSVVARAKSERPRNPGGWVATALVEGWRW